MITRLFKLAVLIPIAIVLILLSVANRQNVRLSLDPFNTVDPVIAMELPLFAIVFLAVLVGVIIGGIGAWLRQGKNRRKMREQQNMQSQEKQNSKSAKDEAKDILNEASDAQALPAPSRAA